MKSIAIKNGDFDFSRIVTGKEEIAQCLELEIGTIEGEFELDLELGRNRELLHDKPQEEDIVAEVRRIIDKDERVSLVGDITITSDKKTRVAFIQFTVEEIATGEAWEQEVQIGGTI